MTNKKKRLKVNKAGEISSAGMQASLGPLSSAALLTQRYLKTDKKKKKKSIIPEASLIKRVSDDLDTLIEYLERGKDKGGPGKGK